MPTAMAPICLMACESGRAFATQVAEHVGVPLTPTREIWFSCGEGKLEIDANIRGTDAYVFQSPLGDADGRSVYDRFVMLLHAVEAATLADAQFITVVLPYYPGARQDKRRGRAREGISAGLFARMLSAAGASRVMTLEIHNDAIAGMFDPRVTRLENIYLTKHMTQWLKENALSAEVVVAPDLGGLERARRYAEELHADLAALSKERAYSTPNTVVTATLIGEVAERDVLLVDDIIDTAGSVVAAVDELKQHGARNILACCAHPVLSGPAWQRLGQLVERAEREGWSFQLVGTSSIRHADPPVWYRSFPIEHVISLIIKKINSRGSVTLVQDRRE
jgi:ribose-phosphate pyrophosphokinase